MDGEVVTVSVTISGDEEQRHLGLLVEDGKASFIYHLAWHHDFQKSTPQEYRENISDYMQVPLDKLTSTESMYIYRHLETVFSRGANVIPYGFNFVEDTVITNDGMVPANLPPGSGLTCSTFVLQVMRNNLLFILDPLSWLPRDDDAAWQAKILGYLARRASKEHVDALAACMGISVRFRPEEVAGCARAYEDDPILFPEGIVLGEQVMGEMRDQGFMAG